MKCIKCKVGKLKKLNTPPTIQLGEVFVGMECLNCGQRQARIIRKKVRRRRSKKEGEDDGSDSNSNTADN